MISVLKRFRAQTANLFDADPRNHEIRRKTVRGAAMTFGGQGTKFLLGILSTAILARVLTPEDFGLIAMTVVFTGFATMFKDAGLATATVQQEKISHEQVSTLFWVNMLLTSCISLIMFLAAPAVAAFYKEPRLIEVTRWLAVAFLVSGISIQHNALLRRQMRFTTLTALDVISTAVGIIAAVILAMWGFRYWALVGMSLAHAVVATAGAWLMIPWLPGRPRRKAGTRRMFKFGTDILSFNVVNYFARQADNLLIGWMWGPIALAFYEKAYRLLLMPIRQINGPMSSVMVPALSRANADPERFARGYLKALEFSTGISVPVVLGFCVFADEVVRVWLGSQWSASAELFRLLTVAAVIGAIQNPMGWLLISSGNTRTYKWLGMGSSVVIVSSFVIGLPYGARGVAIAYSIAAAVNFVPAWWIATRNTSVGFGPLMRSFVPPVVAALIAAAAGYSVAQITVLSVDRIYMVALAALVYGLTYAGILLFCFGRRRLYLEVLREFRGAKPASTRTDTPPRSAVNAGTVHAPRGNA